jgi:hypothetical protein
MLIRLVSHAAGNPKHIDKMIAIKGLPEEWIFRKTDIGTELAPPWKADNEQNIPFDIRHLCEPTYVTFRFAPIEKGQSPVIDHRQILGVVLDHNTEPGREMWERISRFLEGTIPRTERVPEPVLLAKDEHSPFETYMSKRSSTGSIYLEPSPIPEIDLRPYLKPKETKLEVFLPSNPPSPVKIEKSSSPSIFKCEHCEYTHWSPRGVRMHTVKRHSLKEKVGV